MPLAPLDVAVLAGYVAAVVAMAWWLARRQRSGEDYFLAGRRLGGSILGLSVVANQVSAVSLVGAPAFVALREGGGLRWLQYELALPLAMLLIIIVLVPALRSIHGSSIYAYGERRFGRSTRRVLAGSFLLSRGTSLGVVLYASALVVAEVTGAPLVAILLAIGGISILYTGLGGFVADVWTDVLQLVLLWGGTLAGMGYILWHEGADVLGAVPPGRTDTLVPDWGLAGSPFGFWPMLLGGLFLYTSYYGCDQSQAQRLLAARDTAAARRVLLLNGLIRFPLVLTYCLFGLLLAGLLRVDAGFAAAMQGRPPDSLVPVFIVTYLPIGLRGLLVAAILAAAMSSIDSAMNSLAAVTLEDVFDRPAGQQRVWTSRATSVAWGGFAIVSALAVARSGTGVLEAINMIGSVFYGPVLAVYAAGVLAPGVSQRGAIAGLGAGLFANVSVGLLAPRVSWLWWNPLGFSVALATGLILSGTGVAPRGRWQWPVLEGRWLVGGFVLMLLVLAALPRFW